MSGEMEAPSRPAVVARLRSDGVICAPGDVHPKEGAVGRGAPVMERVARFASSALKTEFHTGPIPQSVICGFTRKFSVMVGAGIEISKALEVLANQETDVRFGRAVRRTLESVNRGNSLSSAMGKSPEAFPPFYTGLVRAAETGGDMGDIMARFADGLEKSEQLRKKVKTAMVYPLVVVTTTAVVMFFALSFLVPVFTRVFEDMGAPLPALTRAVADTAAFVKSNVAGIAVAAALSVIFPLMIYRRYERAAVFVDRMVFMSPVFGEMAHKSVLSRFCSTLASLLRGGVPLVDALETVSTAFPNRYFSGAIISAARRIVKGGGVASSFGGQAAFPAIFVSMIDAGERAGKLPDMLETLSEAYLREADSLSAAVQSSVESAAVLIVGAVVSVIVISMYLPIFSLVSLFAG